MRYTEENKPSSPTEVVLAHHGVKGMKWGERKKKVSSGEIHDARSRQFARQRKVASATDKLNLASSAKNEKATKSAAKEFVKAKKDFLTNEDRVTAARATKGEKIAHILLLGPFAAVSLPANKLHERSVAKRVDKARKNG